MNVPAALVASVVAALVALAPARASASASAEGKPEASKKERIVEIAVTNEGFVPSKVKARKGESVKLVVTRKTDQTCATEIVMNDFGVNQPLPLDKTIAVTVTPKKPGAYKFACAMGHVTGVLEIE
jgi:plastocyanin domain-containing protein